MCLVSPLGFLLISKDKLTNQELSMLKPIFGKFGGKWKTIGNKVMFLFPHHTSQIPKKSYTLQDIRKKYPRAYESWPHHEDELLIKAKHYGFSDRYLAKLLDRKEEDIYQQRKKINLKPDFKLVDTCAAEFKAFTPYYYSTYDRQ